MLKQLFFIGSEILALQNKLNQSAKTGVRQDENTLFLLFYSPAVWRSILFTVEEIVNRTGEKSNQISSTCELY